MAGVPGCRKGNVRVNTHYVNGVLTSKNGFSGTGLNCNKGERLYDTSIKCPFFFVPKDTPPEEEFRPLTQEVAPGVMPYYAISNYGRLMNKYSGKVMKENIRPVGYGYYCLASEKGQTKYTSHVIIAKTFLPNDDPEHKTQINHINGVKLDNYINKKMPDGSIQSNLEWVTSKENIEKAFETGLKLTNHTVLTEEDVHFVCKQLEEGKSIAQICRVRPDFYYNTIRLIRDRKTWKRITKDYNY